MTHPPEVDKLRPAIIIKDLSKQFNDITAVDHVSLEVDVGEIFGLRARVCLLFM
ncbi:MAG: hypothetical protein NWE83_10035 [Candidatus Bathyarchaeota archaeon]|jgi:ABC-type sugar transport system ATPase subunit|nr:hypothetical protein [Candidatus Bathyarchaeota archaeon]